MTSHEPEQAPGALGPVGNMKCREKAGFLFSHHCKNMAVEQCQRCNRPVCDAHRTQGEQGALCVTCGKKQRRRGHGIEPGYSNNPYFFSSYYYDGYGYYGAGSWGYGYHESNAMDPHDFSEADGASLQSGDDDFEHDMGAS